MLVIETGWMSQNPKGNVDLFNRGILWQNDTISSIKIHLKNTVNIFPRGIESLSSFEAKQSLHKIVEIAIFNDTKIVIATI
jgi:hypothetical protein